MGCIKKISAISYRNFDKFTFSFSKNCNVFYGRNGSGKTNILEAISLLSKGKGIRKDKLSNIIKRNHKKFIINADFYHNEIVYKITTETYLSNEKILKKILINNEKSKEMIENISNLSPYLYFMPDTERLFLSSPSSRRNFIDLFIYSHNFTYNKTVNQYNKNILERSKLLNNIGYDENWLRKIEENISHSALEIYSLREKQVGILIENLNFFLSYYNLPFSITAKLNDNFFNKKLSHDDYINTLRQNRKFDQIIGGSKIGPHKSDYLFHVNDEYLASQLSTGQQKTLILLIFLSQCKYLKEMLNKKPILLLDEICSHLDDLNRKILLALVESFDMQIFMTGTTRNLFSFLSTNTNFCNITD